MTSSGDIPLVSIEREGSPIRNIAIAISFVLVALVALFAFSRSELGAEPHPLLGQKVPLVQGVPLDGLAGTSVNSAGEPIAYSIDAEAGNWVLVNFFATWCAGCIVEHPELVELEAWGQGNDLNLVAVLFSDPDSTAIRQFFQSEGGNWPVLESPRSAIDFQISQIPESFLVAPNGQVVEHYIGGLRATQVQDTIRDLSQG